MRGKVSFGRIWIITAVPILLITVIALAALSGLALVGLMMQENLRASEIAYETTLRLKDKDLTLLRDSSEITRILNLERSQMVAVLYDGEGNLLCQSDTGSYDNWWKVPRENYDALLKRLKEIQMTDQREAAAYENANPYGISFLYGRKFFTADEKTYILRYGALIMPWYRHGRAFITGGSGVLFLMFLLTTLISGHYYRIYQERIRAEEYYRSTSSALAHDLKTPLMAISGYAEILQENIHTGKRNYYAEGILKNVAVMDSIIESMLELAKLENPKIILVKEEVNLRKMTEQLLEQFQAEIVSKDLKITLQGTSCVSADRLLIKRALENLLSNAVKHTPEEQEIIIIMDMKGYQIKNTGVIIPEDKLVHVWEPFVKGESARTGVSGTGIGLTIVKEISDLHGFACEIKNEKNSVSVTVYFH